MKKLSYKKTSERQFNEPEKLKLMKRRNILLVAIGNLKKEPNINLGAEELSKWDGCSMVQRELRPYEERISEFENKKSRNNSGIRQEKLEIFWSEKSTENWVH